MRVLLAGCGDVGGRLAQRLLDQGAEVYGLRRRTAGLPAGVIPVEADLGQALLPPQWPVGALDYVVYCAAASAHTEAGYRLAYVQGMAHVLEWLARSDQQPRRILFTSSSGVYAQDDGVWVDEDSAAEGDGFSARLMREAESHLLNSGLPATVVRLTGLYGPGRQRLLQQAWQGAAVQQQAPLYANRIHVDDAAGLLAYLLAADQRGEPLASCYLGVDDDPAPLQEVLSWLRRKLGAPTAQADQWVRRAGSKRCSNARARALGWRPMYPSYREGYTQILAEQPWRPNGA